MSSKMEVMRMAISATQRGKLISAGYTSLSSLSSISASVFARDLNISEDEALEILKAASHSSRLEPSAGNHAILNGVQNAWEMFHDSSVQITTSSADVDSILGGGISCREVTEIGGTPGIGKTQFGIQLAINVQIPVELGGLGGKAIYVDTEGSFMVERALQIAEGCVEDMQKDNSFQQRDFQAVKNKLIDPKDFLANIYHFRICSYTEQIAMINHLDKWISEHRDVKLVVIDSVTFYFRQDFEDMALRTRILGDLALKLMKLAKYNLAVVLLNQVATKCTEGLYQLTLALGDSWSHASTNRIILHWKGEDRCANVEKSPSLPSASATYSITNKGIRDSSKSCKRIKMM